MRSFFARLRSRFVNAGHGARLGLLGIVIAVASSFGTRMWLVESAEVPPVGVQVPRVSMNEPISSKEPLESNYPKEDHAAAAVTAGRRFLALQNAWESRLTAKAAQALEQAFPGRAVVTVNLELSTQTEMRSGVNVPPEGLQPNLVETLVPTEVTEPALAQPVMTDPNRAPAVPAFASKLRRDATRRVYRKQIDVTLYGRKTVVQLAPTIRRITASIVLDAAALAAYEDPTATKAEVVDIVKHAIGFDAARGDRMHAPAVLSFPPPPSTGGGAAEVAWTLLAITLLVVAVSFCATWALRGSVTNSALASTDPEELAQRLRGEIETAIEDDPHEVAQILGEWAAEARS